MFRLNYLINGREFTRELTKITTKSFFKKNKTTVKGWYFRFQNWGCQNVLQWSFVSMVQISGENSKLFLSMCSVKGTKIHLFLDCVLALNFENNIFWDQIFPKFWNNICQNHNHHITMCPCHKRQSIWRKSEFGTTFSPKKVNEKNCTKICENRCEHVTIRLCAKFSQFVEDQILGSNLSEKIK